MLLGSASIFAETAVLRETPLEPTVAPAGAKCAAGTFTGPLLVATEKDGISISCCLDRRAENPTETVREKVPLMIEMLLDCPWFSRVSPSTLGGMGVSSGVHSSKTSWSCETSPTGSVPPGGSQWADCPRRRGAASELAART